MGKNRFKKAVNKRMSIVDALSEAQTIAFAPLTFQAIGSMIDLGMLEFLASTSATKEEIMSNLNLDEYTVVTLLQIAEIAKIVNLDNEIYSITPKGEAFLYDDMTIANFNFVRDVCYLGASELTNSFKNSQPSGLQKFIQNSETIYPLLPVLPEKMKKSWYEFDHLYSDNCFEQVFEIITQKHSSICDIGGNTGKFEMVCLEHNVDFDITMFDLPENIKEAQKNPKLINCKFHSINVLDNNVIYPPINNGAVLMSQFLDCFSKEQIV
ncbi:MAG: winged helix-turn-helix domain-containing protein, partial [Candidatus Gastranaerophilales bacterium]|nr:winged helix-turn-helix domain-containing protein [Candidatus Gastranaerophilales bacterium]